MAADTITRDDRRQTGTPLQKLARNVPSIALQHWCSRQVSHYIVLLIRLSTRILFFLPGLSDALPLL
jgi:hypothetical protein